MTVLVLADVAVVYGRLGRFEFAAPADRPGETFLILGSDSRAELPADRAATLGTQAMMPGARADVVLLVHVPARGRPKVLGLPRDLLVFADGAVPRRLAITMLHGPQSTADALCHSIGVAVDHVVLVDFSGFEQVVDSAGGVRIAVGTPVRDRVTGLQLDTPGVHRLDGRDALAYVRSRHPETRANGEWQPVPAGAAGRPTQALGVLRSLAGSLDLRPIRDQRLAWAAAGAVTVDTSMGIGDLARLASALRSLRPGETAGLPARTTETPVPIATLDHGATAALRTVGATTGTADIGAGGCRAALLHAYRPSAGTDT